ncbi:hypothetical protein GBAR_LOCUS4927 [Geodia barretti]|uniref:Uncharacterized protein n=1 Tax=Geodia barretti TaxID=519541 RepID=A0AA35RA38_GEOBA|nr:hypothetical protein GBAR_LOCUS4927 [Geodia barretti]
MAWRMKVRLPRLKVTQRSTSSPATKVPRGRRGGGGVAISAEEEASEAPSGSEMRHDEVRDEDHAVVFSDVYHDHDVVREPSPTLHEINEAANATSWKNIRSELLRAITESFAMPLGKKCCMCSEAAACRCVQCGAAIYYCIKCFEGSHSTANILKCGMHTTFYNVFLLRL